MPEPAVDVNRRFYGDLWAASRLVGPERFNTWPVLSRLAATAASRLEVGPGLRPRLPLAGTCFVDVSAEAVSLLRRAGGLAIQAEITALPLPSGRFDLVCAFDVVEHVADDAGIFRELERVTHAGAAIVLSVPLHPERWSAFDTVVGHVRRYAPSELLAVLAAHGLAIEASAVFGMEPRSRWLLDLAAWGLTHRPARAMRWYDAYIMPIGLRLQRRLSLVPGLVDTAGVGEILLVCRRVERAGP